MHRRSKNPPNWNVWNPPWSKSINYSSIYDKRREFQRMIHKVKIEGPNTCDMSSCCIFDCTKFCSSKIQKKVDAIFFEDSENFNCLLLQLVLDEQYFMKKFNSLIVFLNKTRNCKIFELQNSCIYISCKEGLKWPMFYNLFKSLLLKPSKTIIGVKFYTHFVCKSMISSELSLLLIPPPKYDVPKSEAQYQKFESEKVVDSKSAKISSANLEAMSSCNTILPPKKKLRADCQELSECEQIVHKACKCYETKWQQYKPILKFSRHDYKHILEDKGILMKNVLNNPLISCSNIGLETLKKVKFSENSTKMLVSSENTLRESGTDKIPLKRKLSGGYPEKSNRSKLTAGNYKSHINNEVPFKSNETSTDNSETKNSFANFKSALSSVSRRYDDSLETPPKLSKNLSEIPTFQTASGKSILISDKACQIAEKIYTEICSQSTESDKQEEMKTFSTMNSKKEFRRYDDSLETSPKLSKNLSEIPTFQTASGKSILITDKARQIAEKIYTEICSQSTESDKQEEMKTFSTMNSKKEFNDDELDIFFKDVCNETDFQCSSSTQGNNFLQHQQGKSRKSLGGRRSLKPYSPKV